MYPALYQINTRPWLKQFGHGTTLADIPDDFWLDLKSKGMDYIWLMGVWETSQGSIEKHCFHPDLVKGYDKVSALWTKEDITGSPYAIEDYTVSHLLGKKGDLQKTKRQINRLGLKLILDFVPNHFNSDSQLVLDYPEVFIQMEKGTDYDNQGFFCNSDKIFAHGRDPYFSPWSDTVQINYFSDVAQEFMTERLLAVAKLCDGVRCDMAMLILPDIFIKTWGHLNKDQNKPNDFWTQAISTTREKHKDFLFIAEAYWDTQWRLQQLGFDYTYDKRIIDLLKEKDISELKLHLKGSLDYQDKCLRFIENHDEERSLSVLGDERAKAASLLLGTIPGMKLYYDGQWQGQRKKYPVQMGTFFDNEDCACSLQTFSSAPANPCSCMQAHYDRLLNAVNQTVFKKGEWSLLQNSGQDTVVFRWQFHQEERIVAINLGSTLDQAECQLPSETWKGDYIDSLSGLKNPTFARRTLDGFLFELPANKGCIIAPTS